MRTYIEGSIGRQLAEQNELRAWHDCGRHRWILSTRAGDAAYWRCTRPGCGVGTRTNDHKPPRPSSRDEMVTIARKES